SISGSISLPTLCTNSFVSPGAISISEARLSCAYFALLPPATMSICSPALLYAYSWALEILTGRSNLLVTLNTAPGWGRIGVGSNLPVNVASNGAGPLITQTFGLEASAVPPRSAHDLPPEAVAGAAGVGAAGVGAALSAGWADPVSDAAGAAPSFF